MKPIFKIFLLLFSVSMFAQTGPTTTVKGKVVYDYQPASTTNIKYLTVNPTSKELEFRTVNDVVPIIVDAMPVNGSANAVSSNGVFDGLQVKEDKKPVVSKGLITGDSTLAAWLGQNSVASYLISSAETNIGSTIVSIAVGGNTILQQKAIWDARSDKNTFDYIIVQIGHNDLADDIATIKSRLQSYIDDINATKKTDCVVILGTLTPARKRYDIDTPGGLGYSNWLALNDAIMGVGSSPITGVSYRANNHTICLEDFDKTDTNINGRLARIYDLGDGIHENNDAREIIAYSYKEILNTLGYLKIDSKEAPEKYYLTGLKTKGLILSNDVIYGTSEMGVFKTSENDTFKQLINLQWSTANRGLVIGRQGSFESIQLKGYNGTSTVLYADFGYDVSTISSPVLQFGTDSESQANKKTIRFGAGGYNPPGAFGVDSLGDKLVFYQGIDFDGRFGVSDTGDVWVKSISTNTGSQGLGSFSVYTQQGLSTPVNRFFVGGTGNVGVGTTVPAYKFEVAGTGGFSGQLTIPQGTESTSAVRKDQLDLKESINTYSAKTANYTLIPADYIIDFTTGSNTGTLPSAVDNPNKRYTIKSSSSGTTTISTTASQTIDGASSQTLTVQNSAIHLISDGANWKILYKYTP